MEKIGGKYLNQKSIKKYHVLSLGAGVQSSTLALMADRDLITFEDEIVKPEFAIFADTQNEPSEVYDWLEYLRKTLSFPIYTVSRGNLAEDNSKLRLGRTGLYKDITIPFNVGGYKRGKIQRRCTGRYKIDPVAKFIRNYYKPKYVMRNKKRHYTEVVYQWLGISTDEAHRQKEAKRKYIVNYYPLIHKSISRNDCLEWMVDNNLPIPPRSACWHCPYHSDREWLDIKINKPDEFQKAVELEEAVTLLENKPMFLHRSYKPLKDVIFKVGDNEKQFGNECEGMCGI